MLIAGGQGPKRKKGTVTNDNVAVVHDLVRTYVASHSVCFTNSSLAPYRSVPCPWTSIFSDIFFFLRTSRYSVYKHPVCVCVCDLDRESLGYNVLHKKVEIGYVLDAVVNFICDVLSIELVR